MSLPIRPPYNVRAVGDALAAPLHDAPGPLAATLHDRYGDPYAVLVRGGPKGGPTWLMSAPGDTYWPRWKYETMVWAELESGGPGRVRLVCPNVPTIVLTGAQCLEFYDDSGRLDALAHRVLSSDTWAFTSCADADWKAALARFGYLGAS